MYMQKQQAHAHQGVQMLCARENVCGAGVSWLVGQPRTHWTPQASNPTSQNASRMGAMPSAAFGPAHHGGATHPPPINNRRTGIKMHACRPSAVSGQREHVQWSSI